MPAGCATISANSSPSSCAKYLSTRSSRVSTCSASAASPVTKASIASRTIGSTAADISCRLPAGVDGAAAASSITRSHRLPHRSPIRSRSVTTLERRRDQPQIGGHVLAAGQDPQALLVQLELEPIDLGVAVDDLLGAPGVAVDEGADPAHQQLAHDGAHRAHALAQQRQLGLVFAIAWGARMVDISAEAPGDVVLGLGIRGLA